MAFPRLNLYLTQFFSFKLRGYMFTYPTCNSEALFVMNKTFLIKGFNLKFKSMSI